MASVRASAVGVLRATSEWRVRDSAEEGWAWKKKHCAGWRDAVRAQSVAGSGAAVAQGARCAVKTTSRPRPDQVPSEARRRPKAVPNGTGKGRSEAGGRGRGCVERGNC